MTDRELDILAAHCVMGWRITALYTDPGAQTQTVQNLSAPGGISSIGLLPDYRTVYRLGSSEREIPHYSTDIADAWMLVEAMRCRGFWLKLMSPFCKDGKAWHAGFTAHGVTGWNGCPDFRAEADTAPEAICLAALKAIGGATD